MEITVVCCENRMEYVNKLCDQLTYDSVYLPVIIIIIQGLTHIQIWRVVHKLSYDFLHLQFLAITNLQKH